MNKQFLLTVIIAIYSSVTSDLLQVSDYDHENKKPICPSVCNTMACGMGILTCSDSGLTELPKLLPPNTKKVLIINHDFSKSNTLSKDNFTNYIFPEHNITKITIQNCSLVEIKPETFSRLSNLETLDLSFNKLREIKQRTFANLNLNFLRLDGNVNIQLSSLSFRDLQITSLSLIDCKLSEISYTVFEPIFPTLKRLMLSKNLFKIIESRFDLLFQRLEIIGLEDNRLDCSQCSLYWLISSMKTKLIKRADTQKLLFPRCYLPPRLKDKYIHDLSAEDLVCPKPSVHRISILILPNNSATLTCTASDQQSNVVWTQLYSQNNTLPYTSKDILLSEAVHSNNLVINQRQSIDIFSCIVTSPLGNRSSTKLQISWPKTRHPLNNKLWKDSVTLMPKENNSKTYFFQPQFSLIEMIAGVVGTFIGTLIVFIAMLRCIFHRVQFCTKSSQLRSHQLSSCKEKSKHYMTYEPPLYSDSQTYDIPVSLSPSTNNNQSSVGHFIDFKTQQTFYDRNDR